MKCLFDGNEATHRITTRSFSAPVCAITLERWIALGLVIEVTAIETGLDGGPTAPTGIASPVSTVAAGNVAEAVGGVWGGGTA